MPAVGFVLLLHSDVADAALAEALGAAVPGLLIGARCARRWPVASWAERPSQVEAQAEALAQVDGVMDVEVACVDWRGESAESDLQFDWNELRGRRRAA